MSGDYSRYDFNPVHNFQGVLLQQGRPLTDGDWNELVAETFRLAQATALDTFGGAAVVPTTTPDVFALAWNGGTLTIGRGRIYVDGLLAENHGAAPVDWDSALAESFGTQPVAYDSQPHYPDPPALPAAGKHLVYVDVWKREVNQYEAPHIVEKAIGVDSTTRTQVIWQVKILPFANNAGDPLTCSSDPATIPGWDDLIAPSSGRLSTQVAQYGSSDPCIIPPTGGYTGLENQLYRVEIHDGGAPGTATFKWSRDNASVEARVLSFTNATSFVVDSVGKDEMLRFNPGDWIELTDNRLELNGQPGVMLKIQTNGVDDGTRTITVENIIDPSVFPLGTPDPLRRTRIRRWDQKGQVLRTDTSPPSTYADLTGGTGVITVPAANTVSIALENGIAVTFDVAAAGGTFKSGDYWMFAARAIDASIETLAEAPPRGIHHHYARLGFITVPGGTTDCRQSWPPDSTDSCACTICVSPAAHAQGKPSLQTAIDTVIKQGGGTVCMEAGEYDLAQPLIILRASGLTLRGQRSATQLVAAQGTAVMVVGSDDVSLESFAVSARPAEGNASSNMGIILYQSRQVDLADLGISAVNEAGALAPGTSFAAVACAGVLDEINIRDNHFTTPFGIVSLRFSGNNAAAGGSNDVANMRGGMSLGAAGIRRLAVDRNTFQCGDSAMAIQFAEESLALVRVHENRIAGSANRGVSLTGPTLSASSIEISANYIANGGLAVQVEGCAQSAVVVRDNTLIGIDNNHAEAQAVSLANLLSAAVLDNCFERIGQASTQASTSSILLQQCPVATISRNQLLDVGPSKPTEGRSAAISVWQDSGTVAIGANVMRQSALAASNRAFPWYGIYMPGAAQAGAVVAPVAVASAKASKTSRSAKTSPAAVANAAPAVATGNNIANATANAATATANAAGSAAIASAVNATTVIDVSNNFIEAQAGARAALIQGALSCSYCNNQSALPVSKQRVPSADVQIDANTVIMGHNRVMGSRLSAELGQAGSTVAATVLGNITRGEILLNGQPLSGTPWNTLNIHA